MFLLLSFLVLGSFAHANLHNDFAFEQERMLLAEDGIYIISSFDDTDKVTAYSYHGNLLWDTSFHAKITSWQVMGNSIIVFSKHRYNTKTYLTCLDRYSGAVVWQRP